MKTGKIIAQVGALVDRTTDTAAATVTKSINRPSFWPLLIVFAVVPNRPVSVFVSEENASESFR